MNSNNITKHLSVGFMASFYIMMFVVPAAIITFSLILAANTKFK